MVALAKLAVVQTNTSWYSAIEALKAAERAFFFFFYIGPFTCTCTTDVNTDTQIVIILCLVFRIHAGVSHLSTCYFVCCWQMKANATDDPEENELSSLHGCIGA
ncbi:hypothetical protein TRVL_10245 [Trypanosoma vivax]|nr:hypothetical protein TRVL_10245 [Trypanosoma vivax]